MTLPSARHDLPPEKFPLTLRIYSGKTGECVWSRTVTFDEARQLAKVDIPGYAGTDHYPVRVEITYADGDHFFFPTNTTAVSPPASCHCGLPFSRASGTARTLVGRPSAPTGHDHDDNCETRTLYCAEGHETCGSVQRRCGACDWQGKTTCNIPGCCPGLKWERWPAGVTP